MRIMVKTEIFQNENEARLAGYVSIEEAIKIRPGDHSNYVKQLKKGIFKGCQVYKGSRLVWYVAVSSLREGKKEKSDYEELKTAWLQQMRSGAFTGKPLSKKYVEGVLEYGLKLFFQILQTKPSIEALNAENFSRVMGSEELKVNDVLRQDRYATKTHIYRACTRFTDFLIHAGLKAQADRDAFKRHLPRAKFKPKKRMLELEEIEEALKFNSSWLDGRKQYDVESLDLLIHLYAFAGLRRMEAASLRISDLDFKNDLMIVFGKGSKERHVPLDLFPELKPRIERWLTKIRLQSGSGLLIEQLDGTPLTESSINQRFKRLRQAINTQKAYQKLREEARPDTSMEELRQKARVLAKAMKSGPRAHDLRRAFATMLAKQGMPMPMIQLILGHEDLKTTQGYVMTNIRHVMEWTASRRREVKPDTLDPEKPVTLNRRALLLEALKNRMK
jgi:integrase